MTINDVPIILGSVSAAAALCTLARGLLTPHSRVFGDVISRAVPGSRAVALTFDDGPCPGPTETVLDILREARTPAAFFVIGRYAQRHPALLWRMHSEGHMVCNHSHDHWRFGTMRWAAYWREQIGLCDSAIADALGPAWHKQPKLFRPPMGFKTPRVMAAARAKAHRVVTWSRRSGDGVETTAERVIESIVPRAAPGDILLFHDGRDPASRRVSHAVTAALPRVLNGLRSRGIPIARLDDLIVTTS